MTMIMASTANRRRTIISRPSELPMVFVSRVCVVFSVVFAAIAGDATNIPLMTGIRMMIMIATVIKDRIAAMII